MKEYPIINEFYTDEPPASWTEWLAGIFILGLIAVFLYELLLVLFA